MGGQPDAGLLGDRDQLRQEEAQALPELLVADRGHSLGAAAGPVAHVTMPSRMGWSGSISERSKATDMAPPRAKGPRFQPQTPAIETDRKSTRLNYSH